MEEELDTGWIKNFEIEEKDYDGFYKESISHIKAYYLFVNSTNEIHKIKRENILLQENSILPKETLISMIKKNQIDKDHKYNLISLLKYNITLEPEHIQQFLSTTSENTYIQPITTISDISYDPSINIFQDLNSIYFIFHELKKKLNHSNTKKIYLKTNNRKTKKRNLKT
jgi:hypothetical protein